ncbi:MAG: gamma-glutamylcyclotransferase family protein [Planctomycetaceae bacterium]
MTLIFVYGTLMRGECRHPPLAEQTFVANALTTPQYLLYNCGSYPALVDPCAPTSQALHDRRERPDEAHGQVAGEVPSPQSIAGELYEVDDLTLQRLDEIEEVDAGLYLRQRVFLLPPWNEVTAEAWFYNQPTTHLPLCGNDWRLRPR